VKVEITAVYENGRAIQKFPYGETNQEHCIHGIKLRWSCDDCDDFEDVKPDLAPGWTAAMLYLWNYPDDEYENAARALNIEAHRQGIKLDGGK
jgi:hypothetical protein